jgi:fumarate reductase subunit C
MENMKTALSSVEGLTGALLGVVIVFSIILIGLVVFLIVVRWKMFEQAGEDGWKSIIPFYNTWVLKDIAEVNWWWFLIALLSTVITTGSSSDAESSYSMVLSVGSLLANLVFYTNIAKKYGKDTGFGVLCAILPIIGLPMLVFGNNTFNKNIEVPSNGIFGGAPLPKGETNQTKTTSAKFCPNCGKQVEANINNCPNCGTKLK